MIGDEAMRATRELIEAADRVRQAFGISEDFPDGRTFGRRQLDEVETLKARVSDLARRLTDETTRVNALRTMVHEIQDGYATQQGFEDLIERVRRLESQAELLVDIENRLDAYGVPVATRPGLDRIGPEISLTGGVVQVVDQITEDHPTEDKITDHAFRYSAPDRRHCSYQSDSEDEKCGQLKTQHSHYQAQPNRG